MSEHTRRSPYEPDPVEAPEKAPPAERVVPGMEKTESDENVPASDTGPVVSETGSDDAADDAGDDAEG